MLILALKKELVSKVTNVTLDTSLISVIDYGGRGVHAQP